jgi:hypothetical protein
MVVNSKIIIPDQHATLAAVPEVQLGSLFPGALLHSSKFDEEIWTGDVLLKSGKTIRAWLKLAPKIKTANDLIGSSIAQWLGIPVARPMLLKVGSEYLLQSKVCRSSDRHVIAFASEDISGAKKINDSPEVGRRHLIGWKFLAHTIVFDEWVMNADRTFSNLLVDGRNIWLIDHGECFGGAAGELWNDCERSEITFENRLCSEFCSQLSREDKLRLAQFCKQFMVQASKLDFEELKSKLKLGLVIDDELSSRIVKLLQRRLQTTHSELCKRLGMPQLRLV